MYLSTPILIIALLASNTLAQLCTPSIASSYEALFSANSATSPSNTGSSGGKTAAEYEMELTAMNNAALNGASNTVTAGLDRKRQATTLSTLTCLTTEKCALTKDNLLLCVNLTTLDFHTVQIAKGSFKTGDYTLIDGRKGNLNVEAKTGGGALNDSATASVKSVSSSATASVAVAKTTATGGAVRAGSVAMFVVGLPVVVGVLVV